MGAAQQLLAFRIANIIQWKLRWGHKLNQWYDFGEPLSYLGCLKIEDTFSLRGRYYCQVAVPRIPAPIVDPPSSLDIKGCIPV